LSNAQAALSLAGQAHISLSRGSSLQPAVYQVSLAIEKVLIQKQQGRIAELNGMHPFLLGDSECSLLPAGHYGAVLHPLQQQQRLLAGQVQNQPQLPFHGQQVWVQAASRQPSYSQQQQMAVPQQMAEHQPAIQQPGVTSQVRIHSLPSAHAWPQPRQQPSVQHMTQMTAPQRVFSTQKSSLNGSARPFVGSAKASAPTSVAAEVHSEASGSDISSSHTSPSTSSPLQGAATGQILLPVIWL